MPVTVSLDADIRESARRALAEDVGAGDVTASLLPADTRARAQVISRESAVLCGAAWFEAVYAQLDPGVTIEWAFADGARVAPDQRVCSVAGGARTLLTGERTALNFLQLLSGTATVARGFADAVEGTGASILDTRKTLPGLRSAQKYAVRCGGCSNHRMGLYDAILIKENHVAGAGSIAAAIAQARAAHPALTLEIEVETLAELEAALGAGADIIMLDNFTLDDTRQAVELTAGRARLEVSGNVEHESLRALANTGVDYISAGALTKNVQAIDFSMRFEV